MKRILAAWLMFFALYGCNTVEGIGKDIRSIGGGPEDSVD